MWSENVLRARGRTAAALTAAILTVALAAQACSDRRYTWHHAPEESQAAVDAGCPYGFGSNLTVFTGTADAAQRAVDNWSNSPGHFETMVDPRCSCIGVGVTRYDGITCCCMFVGIPNSVNFYAYSHKVNNGRAQGTANPPRPYAGEDDERA